jgi:hypothetical protein
MQNRSDFRTQEEYTGYVKGYLAGRLSMISIIAEADARLDNYLAGRKKGRALGKLTLASLNAGKRAQES